MNSRICPNCKEVIRDDAVLCPHCGFRLGASIPFWPPMVSCYGVGLGLIFGVGGICAVAGGYSRFSQPYYDDVISILAGSLGFLMVGIISVPTFLVWLSFQWPGQHIGRKIGLLVTGAGSYYPLWQGLVGSASIILWLFQTLCLVSIFRPGLLLGPFGSRWASFLFMISPFQALLMLGLFALSVRGRR